MQRLLNALVIASLLVSSLPTADASAASQPLDRRSTGTTLPDYLPYLEPPDSHPLLQAVSANLPTLYSIQAELQQPVGPYRTMVTIHGVADLARLKALGVTILATTKNTATVIADRLQLEKLAKLHFFPNHTELTSRLNARGGGKLPTSAASADILAATATATDTDGDGLNDTEEGWWCTSPANPDSDNDKVSDGAEVQALTDWLQHKTTTRPASGKPFAGWPPDHPGCYDSDYDSVPDAVEVYVLGLNPNLESTAHDKFDDGQKLFGITDCPGSGGGCGYGALPRQVDWGVIFSQMPSWVKPPYDSPFVAAFPQPDIEVVDSSIVVTAKTTITTDHTTQSGEAHTYGTAETRGTSTSVADTVSWNNWQEVSISQPASSSHTSLNFHPNRVASPGKPNPGNVAFNFVATGVVAGVTSLACVAAGAFTVGLITEPLAGASWGACALGVIGTKREIDTFNQSVDQFKQDLEQQRGGTNKTIEGAKSLTPQDTVNNQMIDASNQGRVLGASTSIYSVDSTKQLGVQNVYNASYPSYLGPIQTSTAGHSWGAREPRQILSTKNIQSPKRINFQKQNHGEQRLP